MKSMEKALKNSKWPEKEEMNLYTMSRIKEKIETPEKVNKDRDIYYVPRIKKYWSYC